MRLGADAAGGVEDEAGFIGRRQQLRHHLALPAHGLIPVGKDEVIVLSQTVVELLVHRRTGAG
jgi:hypothetical protein